ncbi:hypothetical protein M0805_003342 [Coniferiporia weirii]|nr:hypothetical protein M0805_003342 [Coniferiporia weirii]
MQAEPNHPDNPASGSAAYRSYHVALRLGPRPISFEVARESAWTNHPPSESESSTPRASCGLSLSSWLVIINMPLFMKPLFPYSTCAIIRNPLGIWGSSFDLSCQGHCSPMTYVTG